MIKDLVFACRHEADISYIMPMKAKNKIKLPWVPLRITYLVSLRGLPRCVLTGAP